jgi:actin-like ATPase involved in cell morphogenesis
MAYQLGIDLGTTYTAAAVHRDGRVEIVTLGNRAASIPSVIFLTESEDILTGDPANRRAVTEPDRVAREFKRRLGDTTPLLLGNTPYSPQALMAKLLAWTVNAVAGVEGGPPDRIALTHPANWGPFKKDLLDQAVRLADLAVEVEVLTEPEAAAIFYASHERVEPGSVIAVYDLGGGTFDVAVLRKAEDRWEILGEPEGIEHLGGIDFDESVFNHVRRALSDDFEALDVTDPAVLAAVDRVRHDCVEAKEALSSDTDVSIPVLLPNVQTEVRLTRAEFESMIRPTLQETIGALRRALQSAGIEADEVSTVLLVGGASRMPLVSQLVSAEIGRPVAVDAHPKHAIALGSAIAASTPGSDVPAAVEVAAGTEDPTPAVEEVTAALATAPDVVAAPEPEPAGVGTGGGGDAGASRKPPWKLIGAAAAIVLVAAGALAMTGGGGGGEPAEAGTGTAAPTAVEGEWQALRDAPTARQQVAAAELDGTIWAVGGLTEDGSTAAVEGYDPAIDTWKAGPDLPVALHHAAAVTYQGELVVLGGWIPEGANLSAAESDKVFVLRGAEWVELAPLNRPRAAMAAAVVDDKIVVAGGQAGGELVAETEVFDGSAWNDADPMPTLREHVAAAAHEGFVYVVGGRALSSDANSAALERFDPVSGAWEELAEMPTPRGGLAAAIAEGRLIAVGGEHATGTYDTVEAFDIASGAWEEFPAMPTARHGLGAVAVGSSLYAVAGGPKPSHTGATAVNEVLLVSAVEVEPEGDGAGGGTAGAAGPRLEVTEVRVEDGRYVFDYEAVGFTPLINDPGAFHVHFFWDTLLAMNAGVNGPDPGAWLLWDTPFTVSDAFFDVAGQPKGSRQICGIVVNNSHEVADVNADGEIDLDTGDCADLPEA